MSRRKDIARAIAGHPFRNRAPVHPLMLTCSKCRTTMPETFVAQHIIDCQDGKAECGKCHTYINAHEFVHHFKNCPGRVGVDETRERARASERAPG